MARRTHVVGVFAGVVGMTTLGFLIVSGTWVAPSDRTLEGGGQDGSSPADRPTWPEDGQAQDADARTARRGYSGTDRARTGRRRRARRQQPVDPRSWRERRFVADDAVESFATRLREPWRYPELLRRLFHVGGKPTNEFDDATDRWSTETRFQREPERMAALLADALADAAHPATRQALIFHSAIAFAGPRAEQLLAPYLTGDPADAEDALCALAFTGSETAVARFEELASVPSTAKLRPATDWRGDLVENERAGDRALLRSYRCIDALDRSTYFHIHGLWYDGVGEPFPWAHRRRTSAEHTQRLLEGWLRRYPGHNGSDDMAYRLARIHHDAGRGVEALRWATRSAVLPDSDMRHAAVALTKALVEFVPDGAEHARMLLASGEDVRERELVTYMLIRRTAHDFGYEAGLRVADDYARSDPETRLSAAFRERWAAPVPRALDSGSAPLGRADPLRRLEPRPVDRPAPTSAAALGRGVPVWIPAVKLRRQFRAWETLAELERRASVAPAESALELVYKQGAVHYHDRDVLYPLYANHDYRSSRRPTARGLALGEGSAPAGSAWLARVSSWDLATAKWAELLSRDPAHPVADRALYSIGLAQVKAADDRALAWNWWQDGREDRVTAAVEAFERLASVHPRSPLRPSASAAARHWRAAHPDLF